MLDLIADVFRDQDLLFERPREQTLATSPLDSFALRRHPNAPTGQLSSQVGYESLRPLDKADQPVLVHRNAGHDVATLPRDVGEGSWRSAVGEFCVSCF